MLKVTRSNLTYLNAWEILPDDTLVGAFPDSLMKIRTSPIISVDRTLNIVYTEAGLPYVLRQPLYKPEWPGHIKASLINETFLACIVQFEYNMRGDTLWEIFQDELALLFSQAPQKRPVDN